MNSETKTCQNCKQNFTIEPEDFSFYEKIKVPPPTFCPECRLQQRMIFRNERTLYKRKSDVPNSQGEIISVFSTDSDQKVYDHKTWWGDSWDALSYGQDIDFSKPFFEQLKKLWWIVPDMALLNINSVNSDYCSITEGNKNCYLVIGGDFNENLMYSSFTFNTKDSSDLHWVFKSDLNYETIDCISCSRLKYSQQCETCFDSSFLFNCKNCNNCFGCVNLRNASYCFFNKQLDKELYREKMREIDLGSFSKIQEFKKTQKESVLKYPQKFARIIRSFNSTGDNLDGVKNCNNCFDVSSGGVKDCGNIWLSYSAVSDCHDCDHFGRNSQECYQVSTVYPGNKILFSKFIFESNNVSYSYNSHNCSDVFGCIGLRNKSYCILNKQYTKEEYGELLPRIIRHMNNMPYINKGRVYKYGEFFPPDLSPFRYNETVAQELFPLSKEDALEQGYKWKDREDRNYQADLKTEDLPDNIKDVNEDIINKVIECEHKGACNEQCTEAFKIIPDELQFYKRMNLPLPRLCPNCRHYQRLKQRNPLKLWHRTCMCDKDNHHNHNAGKCEIEFETSYAPDRPEIVYCEKCYQQEVY